MSSSVQASAAEENVSTLPVKRRRGRPKGSRNKPKEVDCGTGSGETESAPMAKKPRTAKTPKVPKTKKAVDELLTSLGVKNLGKVSLCLKAGILNGVVKLQRPEDDPGNKFGLNQVLVIDSCCYECGRSVKCTVRDVLYQPDYGGNDYEDGAPNATLKCKGKECGGIFVTEICCGEFGYDSGKFHNHCTDCPLFGMCLGDYRERHCFKCGDHYHGSPFGMEGGCYTCDKDTNTEFD